MCAVLIQEKHCQTQHQRVCQTCLYLVNAKINVARHIFASGRIVLACGEKGSQTGPVKQNLTGMPHEYYPGL